MVHMMFMLMPEALMSNAPIHPLHLVLSFHDGSDGAGCSSWHEAAIGEYAEVPATSGRPLWETYQWQPDAGEFDLHDGFASLRVALIHLETLDIKRVWVGPGAGEDAGFLLDLTTRRASSFVGDGARGAALAMGFTVAGVAA